MEGDYILQVNVMRYQNPTHGGISLSPGDGNCNEMCANQLTFCLRPSGTSSSNPEFCPLGIYITPGAGGDNDVYVIGNVDLLGLPNPLPFKGTLWPVSSFITCTEYYSPVRYLYYFRAQFSCM